MDTKESPMEDLAHLLHEVLCEIKKLSESLESTDLDDAKVLLHKELHNMTQPKEIKCIEKIQDKMVDFLEKLTDEKEMRQKRRQETYGKEWRDVQEYKNLAERKPHVSRKLNDLLSSAMAKHFEWLKERDEPLKKAFNQRKLMKKNATMEAKQRDTPQNTLLLDLPKEASVPAPHIPEWDNMKAESLHTDMDFPDILPLAPHIPSEPLDFKHSPLISDAKFSSVSEIIEEVFGKN